jgi:hypothetical protein
MPGDLRCNSSLDVKNEINDLTIQFAKELSNPAVPGTGPSLAGAYFVDLEVLDKVPNGDDKTFDPKTSGAVNTKQPETGKKLDDFETNVIAMSAVNLFPVAFGNEVPVSCPGSTKCTDAYNSYFPDALEATADTQKAMDAALSFYKYIKAFPGTKNAQAFVAIITGVQKGTIKPEDAPKKIDEFFKALDEPYKSCTFDTYATVASYAENYAPVWTNLTASYTYNVFVPNDDAQATKPAFNKIGKIEFTKSGTAVLGKHDAGYDIVYTDSSGVKTALIMRAGQFVTKQDPDVSPINLTGIFQVKSDLTLSPTDTGTIPVLIGTIGNLRVLAAALDVSSDGGKPWYDVANADWAKQLLAALGIIAAIAGFITLVYRLVTYLKSKTKAGQTKAEKEKLREEALDALGDLIAEKKKQREKEALSNDDFPSDEDTYVDSSKALKVKTLDNVAIRQKQNYRDSIESQRSSIEDLSSLGITNDIKDAVGQLVVAEGKVDLLSGWDSLKDSQDSISESLNMSRSNIQSDFKAKSEKLAEETKVSIEKNQKLAEDLAKETKISEDKSQLTEEDEPTSPEEDS